MSEDLLIEQLRVLAKQHPHIQDENHLFMRHYHSHRHNHKYIHMLKECFTHALNHSADDFFLCGQYLTYLVHFQPVVGQELEEQRDKYVRAALAEANSNEAAVKLVAQLLIREGHFLLIQLKLEMEEPNQKNLKAGSIQLLVRLIEEKLKWQHSQLQLSLTVPEGSSKFMRQLSDFLKEKAVNNGELLLQCRIKLLIALIQHQGKQVDSQLKNSVLNCLGYRILSEELRWNLMRLVKLSIPIFKITGNEMVAALVVQNMRHLWQIEYLQLLHVYIIENGESCNRQMLLSLLRGLFSTLLQSQQQIQDFYLVNRKICDIILLISRIGKFDFSKNVANLISTIKKPMLHAPLLISIMFIYQQKVQSQVLQAFSVPLHEMFKNKAEYSNYEEVLDYYSLANFSIENLMTNPEQYDTFLWHMLALRVTFSTNLPSLLQNNRAYRLLPNLFACLFLNIHPEYVTEVIDRLIDVHFQLCRQSLEEISVTQILLTVTPLLEMQMPTVKSLKLFYDSLSKLHKQFSLKEIKSGEMFLQVSGYLQVMSKYTFSFEIIRVMADILLLCLPVQLMSYHAQNILGAMNLLKDVLSVQPNLPIMKVYINLISRSSLIDEIRQQSIADRQEVERLLDLTPGGEEEGLKDCYHIQHYIINRGQYDRSHLYNCWVILLETANPHQTSLPFYIIDLFRYFADCLTQGNVTPICANSSLPEYLHGQIDNILKMLDMVQRRLVDAFVIKQIVQLLTLRQALLLYLYEVLRGMMNFGLYISYNKASEYVEARCSQMQGDRLISRLKGERMAPIRQLWCNCSFLLVLMVPLLLRLREAKVSQHLQDRIIAVERDCEWLRQIMGSEHEKAANRYYLVLASHISELNLTSNT